MKVQLKRDDWYLWYLADDEYFAEEVELSEDFVKRYREASNEFFNVQNELEEIMFLKHKK